MAGRKEIIEREGIEVKERFGGFRSGRRHKKGDRLR